MSRRNWGSLVHPLCTTSYSDSRSNSNGARSNCSLRRLSLQLLLGSNMGYVLALHWRGGSLFAVVFSAFHRLSKRVFYMCRTRRIAGAYVAVAPALDGRPVPNRIDCAHSSINCWPVWCSRTNWVGEAGKPLSSKVYFCNFDFSFISHPPRITRSIVRRHTIDLSETGVTIHFKLLSMREYSLYVVTWSKSSNFTNSSYISGSRMPLAEVI